MKRIFIASLSAIMFCLFSLNLVSAVELSEEQKVTFSQTCVNVQSNLQRISSGDTTTRINRGRNYDQTLKLFYAMNTRVASNNITEPRLSEITKKFENELASFRENYNLYNNQLKSTVDLNCSSNTQEFYNNLDKTRDKRFRLNENVIELNGLIEDYKIIIMEYAS